MKQDWIAFYYNGKICLDVVLQYGTDRTYPHGKYAITPHHGRVEYSSIIEVRVDTSTECDTPVA